jgi:hypothetical protein
MFYACAALAPRYDLSDDHSEIDHDVGQRWHASNVRCVHHVECIDDVVHRRNWQSLRAVDGSQEGKGSRFTSRYHIDRLVYFEVYESVTDAIAREKQIKGRHARGALKANPARRTCRLDSRHFEVLRSHPPSHLAQDDERRRVIPLNSGATPRPTSVSCAARRSSSCRATTPVARSAGISSPSPCRARRPAFLPGRRG